MNVGHADSDEATKLELVAILGDLDGPKIARPVVDILKEMTMDGAQVGEIELARRHAFGDALGHQATFDLVQSVGIRNAKFISEYRLGGLEIRIPSAHSTANGVTAARM
jgi:hypothetical protein